MPATSYFAGALLLPYLRFLAEAEAMRYDIELLSQHFRVSFETVCHRLSTMQRARRTDLPVDRAASHASAAGSQHPGAASR